MSEGDLCKGCQHPRAAHHDIINRECKCGGGACPCTRFE